jgi:hypothetical protein
MDMEFWWSVIAAIIGGAIGTATTLWVHRRQYLLEYQTEAVLKQLLNHERWRLRTFETIQHHVGGFSDDELRRHLIRAGALRFRDSEGIEVWGLLSRNEDLLVQEVGTSKN